MPLPWPASVMTPSQAPPICCGRTAMSPRASVNQRGRRSMRRWRAPAVSTEVFAMPLSTSSNFVKPDDAFRAVVEAHRGLSDAESADLDAALVLVLANHIGDIEVLKEAIALAKRRMLDVGQQQQQQQQ